MQEFGDHVTHAVAGGSGISWYTRLAGVYFGCNSCSLIIYLLTRSINCLFTSFIHSHIHLCILIQSFHSSLSVLSLIHSLCSPGVALVLEVPALYRLLNCWKCSPFFNHYMWVEAIRTSVFFVVKVFLDLSLSVRNNTEHCPVAARTEGHLSPWSLLSKNLATLKNQVTESQCCLLIVSMGISRLFWL